MSDNKWKWSDNQTQPSSTESNPNRYMDYKPGRGGCLTTWLVVVGVANVLVLILTFIGFSHVKTLNVFDVLGIVLGVLIIVCVVAMWCWKKWGYYLLMGVIIVFGVVRLFALFGNNGPYALGSLIGTFMSAVILFLLVRDKLEYFD